MSVQDSITNEIADLIEAEKNIELVIGPNLPENKFCILTGGGNVQDTFLDKSMLSILPITINGKHSDQEYLYKMLNRILEYLIFLKSYPCGDKYQIYDIDYMSSPHLVGRTDDDLYICGFTVRVKFYQTGG